MRRTSARANFRAVWCRDCGSCHNGAIPGKLFEHQMQCLPYLERQEHWSRLLIFELNVGGYYGSVEKNPTDKEWVDYINDCLLYNLKYERIT